MLRLAADENLHNAIVRGILRRNPEADVVRVQDIGLSGATDPVVLTWAAETGRVLLTNDVTTITKYAYERVAAGQKMPGVIEISRAVPISLAIDEIMLFLECSTADEWEGQVLFLPL